MSCKDPHVAPLPALPTLREWRAPPDWTCIDFISDLHLSQDTPRTFDAWAAHLRCTEADAVFILGDLFDVWIGDDARHMGFEAGCAAVLTGAAAQRTVGFMAGNRDFLVGSELLQTCGVQRLEDPTVLIAFGERLLLSHGDALCIADAEYQRFRAEVRSGPWQAAFLARPIAERRDIARDLRQRSEQRKASQPHHAWFDVDSATAVRWMQAAATPHLVHGHTHRPQTESLAPGYTRHVLSDWDLDHAARAQVLRWRRGGLTRVSPARDPGVAARR